MKQESIFINNQVSLDDLPTLDVTKFEPLEKKYLQVILLTAVITYSILILTALVLYFLLDQVKDFVLMGLILLIFLFMVNMFFIIKAFPFKGYALRERDIVYKKGWLSKRITTIPFNRVQHIDIKQGIIERSFHLSRLNLYTAGGQSSDLTIPGLLPERSKQLRGYILNMVIDDEEE
jgi:membrane protein YdbS with pleckstrin-like domain